MTPLEAIERVRDGFVRHAAREWEMPAKVYLHAPPNGDFRAMPARGSGLAMLKWITSFPVNPAKGMPAVMGVICVSNDEDGRPLALIDAQAVTALRTGAVAAIAAQELGPRGRLDGGDHRLRRVRRVGRALPRRGGVRAGHLLRPGPRSRRRPRRRAGLGGRQPRGRARLRRRDLRDAGPRAGGAQRDLRPGMHLNMLGADGPGKAEAEVDAVSRCRLFCDEWEQASHGGELMGAIDAGLVTQADVTEIGEVLTGMSPGRTATDEVTLFDSTGLAIQDLAICHAVLEAHAAGAVKPAVARL